MGNFNNFLPERSVTERLVIYNTMMEEEQVLQGICNSWDNKVLIEGEPFDKNYIKSCLIEGDLPPLPDATKEKYRLKSIQHKESGSVIGFYDLYYGYPTQETIWISLFVMDKKYRKNGYAQEVIEMITRECEKTSFKKMGVGVHLKNWTGLRFWTKTGFTNVFTVYGDKKYSSDTYALIGLEKIIDRTEKI